MNSGLFVFAVICCLASGCCGQQADFTIRVVDDDGVPVSNATVGVSYLTSGGFIGPNGRAAHDNYANVSGMTDATGLYHYQGAFNPDNGLGIEKSGYYDTEKMELTFTGFSLGHLQPWGMQTNIVLRRIINPTGMYALKIGAAIGGVPQLGKPFGFDLVKVDWVAPYGKGEVADFILQLDAAVGRGKDKDETLTITFSNPDDGIQIFQNDPRSGGSLFRSPRYAPLSGYGTNYVSKYYSLGGPNQHDDQKEALNYIFRVRAIRDSQGAITNALYGKIYGPIGYNAPYFSCSYYLNPSPLDRNLEFDRTKNLFQGMAKNGRLLTAP